MNRPSAFVLIAGLAVAGYVLGSRFPVSSVSEESSVPETETSTTEKTPSVAATELPAPASFAEELPRLAELGALVDRHFGAPYLLEGKRRGTDLLEIERIFALADRDDLIAFFADEEAVADHEIVVLNAAYARLADLSLDDALAIWTDRRERTDETDGIAGLVQSWATQDPEATERWIDALDDEALHGSALFVLLDAVAETHPDILARRIYEIGSVFTSPHLATMLARATETNAFPALADRFLVEKKDNWKYQNQLISLLEVWGERDGAAMIKWFLAQPPGTFRTHLYDRMVKARAESDPASFVREIEPLLGTNKSLGEMAGLAWIEWLKQCDDPTEAVAWLAANSDHFPSAETVWNAGHSWNETEVKKILAQLPDLPEGEFKSHLARAVHYQISEADPRFALAYGLESLPPGESRDSLFQYALSHLARDGEPEEAFGWAVQNLEAGEGKTDAVRWVLHAWTRNDPLAALAHAGGLSDELREPGYGAVASVWAETAPDQLLAYLQSPSDPEAAKSVAKDSFWQFGYHRGGENYLSAALAFADEAMRTDAVAGLFGGWANANLESAATTLDQIERGPLRDTAITAFLDQAGNNDREAAVIWSLDIDDPQKRRDATFGQCLRWLAADRPAAVRWIESSKALPDEWKQALLSANQ